MATTIFINHASDWVHTDISHYAYRAHIIELLETKWPSRTEGRTIIQTYQIQPTDSNGDFRIWAPRALSNTNRSCMIAMRRCSARARRAGVRLRRRAYLTGT
nr:hypothetical protein CFP56_03778 [Quercus suber]